MLRLITVVAAFSVASSAFAQSVPHSKSAHKTAPAAAKPSDADEIAAVPRNVQKWVGGAVDDILTGAGQPLKP